MLGIFLLGFISGIIYTNLVAKTYIITMGIFSDFFLEQYSKSKINMNNYSWYIFKLRFAPAVFLALTSLTKLKRIAGVIFLLWTSFLCGVIFTAAILKLGIQGILLCVVSMMPQFIGYIAAYLIILNCMFTYPETRWNSNKSVYVILFLLLGVISECYVNPMLMEMTIRAI